MLNSGWRRARTIVGLPQVRVHEKQSSACKRIEPHSKLRSSLVTSLIMGFTAMITKYFSGLHAGLVVSFSVSAATVEDCIDVYQDYKELYGNSVSKIQPDCSMTGNSIKLYATAAPPYSCIDEDEWNLDVRAVGGKEGKCSVRILGSLGPKCRAEKVEYVLEEEDAELWMEFVSNECDEKKEKE